MSVLLFVVMGAALTWAAWWDIRQRSVPLALAVGVAVLMALYLGGEFFQGNLTFPWIGLPFLVGMAIGMGYPRPHPIMAPLDILLLLLLTLTVPLHHWPLLWTSTGLSTLGMWWWSREDENKNITPPTTEGMSPHLRPFPFLPALWLGGVVTTLWRAAEDVALRIF